MYSVDLEISLQELEDHFEKYMDLVDTAAIDIQINLPSGEKIMLVNYQKYSWAFKSRDDGSNVNEL